jgi:hypothetical protein
VESTEHATTVPPFDDIRFAPTIGLCSPAEFALAFVLSSTVAFENMVEKEGKEDNEEKSTEHAGERDGHVIGGSGKGIRGDWGR